MKLNRWITLGALFGCSVIGFAQTTQDVRTLDIIIRDFQPDHPDFENFSEESVKHLNDIYAYKTAIGTPMNIYGYGDIWYASAPYHNTCGNMNTFQPGLVGARIGVDGLPMEVNPYLPPYLQGTSKSDSVLEYGECTQKMRDALTGKEVTLRGYKNSRADVSGYKCPQGSMNWSNDVIYTPGMVSPYLLFTKMGDDGKLDMYDGVIITKLNERCDNQFFDQWFSDVPGQNKRTEAPMVIPKDANSKYYIYNYNYNNGGYSPLDSINPTTREWVMNKPCQTDVCDQYEPQTLSIFCPPYNYQYANNQADYLGQNTYDLCKQWLDEGGPRATNSYNSGHSAAFQAAVKYDALHPEKGKLGMQHLRNYAFTMMGYASFKYKVANQVPMPEVFEFAGDDDMWIFVDGVLVVDLGGTHLSAPGKVDISVLAKNNHGCHANEPLATYTNCTNANDVDGWADDTWHHLHFFYADRQSDGSNIYIRTSLAELAPSRYGQPSISDAVVKVKEDGTIETSIYMNVALADSSVAAMRNPAVPSLIVLRKSKTIDGRDTTLIYGYYISSLTGPENAGAMGQRYQLDGKLKDSKGVEIEGGLLGGDVLAFNVPWSQGLYDDGNEGHYSSSEWTQLMEWAGKVNFFVASKNGMHVEGFDEREKWGKVTYTSSVETRIALADSAYERPDFSEAAQKLTDIAGSGTLPTDMTADLVLTPIPAVSGIDPITWADTSAIAKDLMKSGANGEVPPGTVVYGAGVTSPTENKTLCYNDGSVAGGGKSNESCMSVSISTTQPFRVNIRVFDHLGHFVNQYNKTVTKNELENALMGVRSSQALTPVPTAGCDDMQMFGPTGALYATIKMYPVTDKGRLIATGPYVYQVTIVKEANISCYASEGKSPTPKPMPFERSTKTYRFGYRRTTNTK